MSSRVKKKGRKTAAVYDRWLHTLGGGEQAAVGFAQALRENGYQTSILSHKAVPKDTIEKRLGVELKDIELKVIPFAYDYDLGPFTKEYDVFVSNSYLDFIQNEAKIGFLSIFFPSRIKVSPFKRWWRTHGVRFVRNYLLYALYDEGLRHVETYQGKALRWLNRQQAKLLLSRPVRDLQLIFTISPFALSVVESIQVFLDGEVVPVSDRYIRREQQQLVMQWKNIPEAFREIRISIKEGAAPSKVALRHWHVPGLRNWLYRLARRYWPELEARLHGGHSILQSNIIQSYDSIVVNSHFTQSWVTKYWGLQSEVVYPPVHTERFSPSTKKKNHIIHVGRFFLGGHNKKQLEMIRLFKELCDSGFSGWEFHLIGSIAEGEQHQQYAERVARSIGDYPIFVHFNVPNAELVKRVNEAKIYWHATGFGERQEVDPINMEHFGITTVEAMAAGCVPVVYAAGGQPEIITADSGFLWEDQPALFHYTRELASNPPLWKKMSKAAYQRSHDFNMEAFHQTFSQLLRQYETKSERS